MATTEIRDARQVLGVLERGGLTVSFSKEFAELIESLNNHAADRGKAAGSITLKLNVTVEGGTARINAELTKKEPKIKRQDTLLFVTPTGALSLQHPQQDEFTFDRTVPRVIEGSLSEQEKKANG